MRLVAEAGDAGVRLDSFIALHTELSRSAAVRLIESGEVLVNGAGAVKKALLSEGDVIDIGETEAEEYEVTAENIPLDIVYEDSDIIVINKPSGMVVHPAKGNYTGTLVNALMHHCKDSLSGVGGVMRPGIVHRIDKDTSGLLVVAKNDKAHVALSAELALHGIVREYHALVKGGFKSASGTVNAHIGRHPQDRKKMAVLSEFDAGAKRAVTHYEVAEAFGQVSYLKLILETGRTHQIRVHMASIGHALLGDGVYGGSACQFEKRHSSLFDGQMLHAKRLVLTHPRTKERMTFECPLPDNFEKALELLRIEAG